MYWKNEDKIGGQNSMKHCTVDELESKIKAEQLVESSCMDSPHQGQMAHT